MAAYGLAVDPGWLGRDHGDAIREAGEALRIALRDIAQEIIDTPRLLDEALGELVGIEARGAAVAQALSGRVITLRHQAREAAQIYALALYASRHGQPDPRALEEARRSGGWEPVLPDLIGVAA